jgi:hypothetical protein
MHINHKCVWTHEEGEEKVCFCSELTLFVSPVRIMPLASSRISPGKKLFVSLKRESKEGERSVKWHSDRQLESVVERVSEEGVDYNDDDEKAVIVLPVCLLNSHLLPVCSKPVIHAA